MQQERMIGVFVANTNNTPEMTLNSLTKMMEVTGQRVCLYFDNWDDDPRELWDIPEVRAWCRKFIELGGLSVLDRPEDASYSLLEVPSQLLVLACSGLPGATRLDKLRFTYDLERIRELERSFHS